MLETKTALANVWKLYALSNLKPPRHFMWKILCSQTGPLTCSINHYCGISRDL